MNTNYIIIGDSITYGIGDFESGGWATIFKNYIVNIDDSKVCKNNRIRYIPMQNVLEKTDYIDGLHPNHNGHKKIAEYIIESIK